MFGFVDRLGHDWSAARWAASNLYLVFRYLNLGYCCLCLLYQRNRLMNIVSRLLCLLPLLATSATADTYPQLTLKAGSMVCLKAGDWSDMVGASIDQDGKAATRLVESGKCRTISSSIKVSVIEPSINEKFSMIQLPSGKTAHTANGWLR